MKKNWKRLIAVFCILAMACSVVPKFEPMQVEAETATTVTYEEFTSGTITGGVAPTEAKAGYVFGGWYKSVSGDEGAYVFSNPLTKDEVVTATTESPVYAKWVPEEVLSVKAQYRQEEEEDAQTTSLQYFDGETATKDETFSYIATNSANTLTVNTETYKEGSGALQSVGKGTERFTIKRTEEQALDASACAGGALSFWLYMKDDPSDLNTVLVIELGSGTGNSDGCYIWRYDTDKLSKGWNKMLLDFRTCSSVAGTVDMSKLRYFNMWRATSVDLTMIIDDIRIVKTEGMLFNCDNIYADETHSANFTSNVTNVAGEYKEGIGAYKVTGTGSNVLWYEITKSTPVDLTNYQTGSLHFWLYVSEPSNLAGALVVQIGNDASNCYRFNLDNTKLISGWNECNLEFDNAYSVSTNLDITQIDTFRIWRVLSDTTKEMTMILDDVRVVKRSEGMLLDCNDTTGITGSGITVTNANTTELKEYQEGNGAYKNASSTGVERHVVKMTNGVNVATDGDKTVCKYSSLRFWLYIDNRNNVNGDLRVEVASSTSSPDTYEIQWSVANQYLVSGWNEIYLNLDMEQKISNSEEPDVVDFSNICWFRIYMGGAAPAALTTILDDVEFVSDNDKAAELRFVSTVDSSNYQSAGFKIALTDVNSVSKGTKTATTKTVYSKLLGISETEGELTYEPTCFHEESEYFYAAIFNKPMPSQVFDSVLTVTPFWITPDGTEVTGVQRTFTMNYIINGVMNLDNH